MEEKAEKRDQKAGENRKKGSCQRRLPGESQQGCFYYLRTSEVLAVAKQAVEETYRSIAVWVGGTPEENDYVQEVYGKATANGREITIVDMIVDEDLLQISYQDRDLSIEKFPSGRICEQESGRRNKG